jgi:phospholipase/lecithinase/hemolysin
MNVDFAWASAETGQRYVNDLSTPFSYPQHCKKPGYVNAHLSCVPGMMLQVQQYLRDLKSTQAKPSKQTMFVLWAGGNDVFNNINRFFYRFRHSKFKPTFLWPEKKLAFSWFPTKKVYDAVKLLIQDGVPAQHIYVFNLPNIGATPGAKFLVRSALGNSQNKQNLALHVIATISKIYNNDLAFWLNYGIRDSQKPHIISTNIVFNQMIKDNRFLGYRFLDIEHSCVRELATPYCAGFLFFNDKHPTTSASILLAFYVAQNL